MIKNFQEIISSGQLKIADLEQIRVERMDYRNQKSKKLLIIGAAIVGITIIIALVSGLIALPVVAIIVYLIVYFVWMFNINKISGDTIKDKLINKLVKSIDESFIYQAKGLVSKDVFKKGGFIKYYSSYSGEDYFKGNIDNISLEFSELHLKVKQDKNYRTVFRGPYFAVQLNQSFEGGSTALPDKLEKGLGGVGRFFQKMNLSRLKDKLVKINNSEFEKYFAVYSKNEKEAHKIFADNLCNFLVNMKNSVGKHSNIYFSFSENKFHLGLNNNQDIFKINIKNSITENTLLSHYNELVGYLNNIIDLHKIIESNMSGKSISFFDLDAPENKIKY